MLISVYDALVFSHIQYCLLLWGNAASVYLHHLIVLQKRVFLIIKRKNQFFSSQIIARELNLLLFDDLFIKTCAVFMHSVKYMYCASNMLDMFVCNANINSYHTRQSLFVFNLPRVQFDISKKFISFHGV